MAEGWEGTERRRQLAGDVSDARAAVVATTRSLDRISDMLRRHFRLGVLAVGAAVILGSGMFGVVAEMNDVVGSLENQTQWTRLQAMTNEVQVLRHRVHEREGHRRLCAIALGASRGPELAAQICDPVVGDDYDELRAKLDSEERQLAKLRETL